MGAVRQIGELTIQAAGRGRPQVVNRRLAELPPLLRDDESVSSLVANFSFSAETAGGSPAVELVPAARAAGSEPRAWAWSETTTSWCHAAGQTESETVFEIENHGRADITLHLPTGRVVEEVFVNGLRQPREGRAATPSLGVELPAGSRFVRVLVRTVAASRPGRAWWWVDQPSVAIDLPVFDRLWRVLVPDGLRLVPTTATGRPVDPVASGWSERLLGASRRRPLAPSVSVTSAGSIEDGFRPQTFLASAVGDGGVTIVRSSVLVTAGTLAAILVMLVAFGLCGRRPWLPLCICVTAAAPLSLGPGTLRADRPTCLVGRSAGGLSAALEGCDSRRDEPPAAHRLRAGLCRHPGGRTGWAGRRPVSAAARVRHAR